MLDLSNLSDLEELDCEGNQISELDLDACPKVRRLDCVGNGIEVLDIQPLAYLEELNYDAETTLLLQRPDQHFEE